jgi:hypothetical protein
MRAARLGRVASWSAVLAVLAVLFVVDGVVSKAGCREHGCQAGEVRGGMRMTEEAKESGSSEVRESSRERW